MMKLPALPYRGLTYYSSQHTGVFAGRENDAQRCADRLFDTDVLILHGRTGCGKSSFLRAGLAPYLERHSYQFRFLRDGRQNFQVVRSGALPLRSLCTDLYSLLTSLQRGEGQLGETLGDISEALLGTENRKDFLEAVGSNASRMIKSIEKLALGIEHPPILVIDQAEEVFTLHEEAEESTVDINEYFEFLRRASNQQLGVKLIVSLRTEYKGQFDDLLAGSHGYAMGRVKGFYLDQLGEEGLIRAIRRPTLTKEELQEEVRFMNPGLFSEEPSTKYGFRYDDGVPELIARDLMKSVPRGGILPALQVICLQLYKRISVRAGDTRIIRERDWKRLGSSDEQVGRFLRETIQDMLRELDPNNGVGPRLPISIDVDKWNMLLLELVRVEPDGRATTGKLGHRELVKKARGLGCQPIAEDPYDGGLAWLATEGRGVLRFEEVEDDVLWSLGHDSLGLTLQRWDLIVGQSSRQTAKMTDMNSARNWAKFTREELYGSEVIMEREVIVPADFLWDHQLPFFAQSRNFSERLGVSFVSDERFNALAGEGSSKLELVEVQRSRIRSHQQRHPGSILVSCERSAFPGIQTEGSQAEQWSEVLISDLFLGNGVVGPAVVDPETNKLLLTPLSDFEDFQEGQRYESMMSALTKTLEFMIEKEAIILCYDETGEDLIRLGAELCGLSDQLGGVHFKREEGLKFAVVDPWFENFERSRSDRVFLVGTAFGRAIATQSGYETYFTSQQLSMLVKRTIERFPEKRTYYVNQLQRILLHTLWQIGIPPTMWNQGIERPFILRLASIGYFTAEYIRSYASDFVGFINDWLDQKMVNEELRVGREVISDSIEDCFNFLSFDEYSRVVFDLDSEFAYFPGGGSERDGASERSIAMDIYLELVELRAQTTRHFASVCRNVDWLRNRRDLYDVMDERFKQAWTLKEQAWKHYRIYNFYDAERMMARAAELLQQLVEKFATSEVAYRGNPPRNHRP